VRVLPASCDREWPAARPAISCQAEDSFILIEDRELAALVETSSTYRRRKVVVSKFGSKLRQERTLLSQLEQRIADDEVKKMLPSPATLRLDQVEGFVFDQMTTNNDPRRPLSNWVEGVEREPASAVVCRGARRKRRRHRSTAIPLSLRVKSATRRQNLIGTEFSSSSARAVGYHSRLSGHDVLHGGGIGDNRGRQ
jgi:hypothetical protein